MSRQSSRHTRERDGSIKADEMMKLLGEPMRSLVFAGGNTYQFVCVLPEILNAAKAEGVHGLITGIASLRSVVSFDSKEFVKERRAEFIRNETSEIQALESKWRDRDRES